MPPLPRRRWQPRRQADNHGGGIGGGGGPTQAAAAAAQSGSAGGYILFVATTLNTIFCIYQGPGGGRGGPHLPLRRRLAGRGHQEELSPADDRRRVAAAAAANKSEPDRLLRRCRPQPALEPEGRRCGRGRQLQEGGPS